MGIVPIVLKPFPDELLFSWIIRLAEINGLKVYDFVKAYFSNVKYRSTNKLPFDIREGFLNFCRALNLNKEEDDLYLSLSTFSYECLGLKEAMQTRVLNNIFYPVDKINTKVNPFFSTLNICPDCIDEDTRNYGRAYYHRAHQLSGIYKCYKHGTVLRKCEGSVIDINNISSIEYKESKEDYSKFAYDLLNANLNTNVDEIVSLCEKHNIKTSKKRFYGSSTKDILPELYTLCKGDIGTLKPLLADNSSIIKKFKCDSCDSNYFGTSFSYSIGCRCPVCVKKDDIQDRFKNMITLAGNKEYEVLSKFESMNKKVLLKHSCGQEVKVTPRGFLYEGIRCECKNVIKFDRAKRNVEDSGGFKLIEFTKANEPITVKSLSCGHVFKTRYHKFIKYKGCRICCPSTMDDYAFEYRVDNISNGDFKFIGPYRGYSTKTKFIHNKCKTIFEATPKYFLEYKVCPYCDSTWNKSWEQGFSLLCEYKNEFKTSNVPKRAKYKGVLLGLWCQRQRKDFKNGSLSNDRTNRLKEIGFIFNPLDDEWERKYEQYKCYIKENGTTKIHRRTIFEGEKLGVWVFIQRKAYKEGKMSNYRVNKLLLLNKNIFK